MAGGNRTRRAFAIGVLPTYAQIGIWAPILLVVARVIQGFSTGGEYGGAATFMCEYAPDKRRGFFGSFLEFGTLAGTGAGAALVTVFTLTLSDEAMTGWAWRIPFLLALPLGLIGLYLRTRLDETPAFAEQDAEHAGSPLAEVVSRHWRNLALCFGIVILINVAYYLVLTYLPGYLTQELGISDEVAPLALTVTILVLMAVIVPLGGMSDRIGRKPVMLTSALGFLVFSVPAFWLLHQGTVWGLALGLAILGLFLVCLTAVIASTLPAIFETRVRYSGFGISYNISTAIFGGTTPYIVERLVNSTGNGYIPAFYVIGAALIGLVPILLLTETAGKPLKGTAAARQLDEQLAASKPDLAGSAPA